MEEQLLLFRDDGRLAFVGGGACRHSSTRTRRYHLVTGSGLAGSSTRGRRGARRRRLRDGWRPLASLYLSTALSQALGILHKHAEAPEPGVSGRLSRRLNWERMGRLSELTSIEATSIEAFAKRFPNVKWMTGELLEDLFGFNAHSLGIVVSRLRSAGVDDLSTVTGTIESKTLGKLEMIRDQSPRQARGQAVAEHAQWAHRWASTGTACPAGPPSDGSRWPSPLAFQQIMTEGTWKRPIVVRATAAAAFLVEGHHRLGYLFGVRAANPALVKESHQVFVLR